MFHARVQRAKGSLFQFRVPSASEFNCRVHARVQRAKALELKLMVSSARAAREVFAGFGVRLPSEHAAREGCRDKLRGSNARAAREGYRV